MDLAQASLSWLSLLGGSASGKFVFRSSKTLVGVLVGLLSLGVSCLPQLWRGRREEKLGYGVEEMERGPK